MTSQSLNELRARINLENLDKREDSQRQMAWLALFGMLFYPVIILLASFLDLTAGVTALTSIAPTYFIAVAAIVAAFYGKEAYIHSPPKVSQVVK